MFNYSSVHYRWLTDAQSEESSFQPDEGVSRQIYPIPPEMGEGWLDLLPLGIGITLYHGVHRFRPAAVGRLVTLIEAEVRYQGPSFAIQAAFGGHICHDEQSPVAELIYGPGQALFRHSERLHLVAKADGSTNSEMVGLTISDAQLGVLLGEAAAAQLLRALGVSEVPSIAVRRLAAAQSAQLRAAIAPRTTGGLRTLQAQAKALGFLAALADDLDIRDGAPPASPDRQALVQALHERLVAIEGKPPGLDELARDFGVSARRLNELFAKEYGAPIHAFVTAQRLGQAHDAVCTTDVPLKSLAARLGYSHVNHFITAFRRQFGIAPGSLRRGRGAAPGGKP